MTESELRFLVSEGMSTKEIAARYDLKRQAVTDAISVLGITKYDTVTEEYLREYAKTGKPWKVMCYERGIPQDRLYAAIKVLGIKRVTKTKPARKRAVNKRLQVLGLYRDADVITVNAISSTLKVERREAIRMAGSCQEAGLIVNTQRRETAPSVRHPVTGDVNAPWAQYVLTEAGRKVLQEIQHANQ